MRQLEIGPGVERLPGFETLNLVKTESTDHVGDARNPPFADETFDLIYASHMCEHVHWHELEPMFAEWARILKPGGSLEVFTVDAAKIMKAVIEYEETGVWTGPDSYLTWRQKAVRGDCYKWAFGRILSYARHKNQSYYHRAMLTPNYLRQIFTQIGLVDIEPLAVERGYRHGWISFGLRGRKPEGLHPTQ